MENNMESFRAQDFWRWVEEHLNDDTTKLRLSARTDKSFDIGQAITQVECRRKYGKKFEETLHLFPQFFFPSGLACEQATSDLLAQYHQEFVDVTDNIVDMTAGLGIDAVHLARKAQKMTAIERNESLVEALKYNCAGLGLKNITIVNEDSNVILNTLHGNVVFIDPARRAADGTRVFSLKDCEPDVTAMYSELSNNFDRMIVKASPMLDISHTANDLPGITDIYVLGTKTECKELVALVNFKKKTEETPEPIVHAVTLSKNCPAIEFTFTRTLEAEATAIIGQQQPVKGDYLFIPYPSVMKAAPVKLLSDRFEVQKFHNNTHLYFGKHSDKSADFPGEALEIIDIIPWQSKNLKKLRLTYPQAMVSVRNFGMTADQLRKKLGIKEGGNARLRLFGIGLGDEHTDRLLILTRD